MSAIRSFRDLRAYRIAHREATKILECSKSFPPHERFGLANQMVRSSRAVSGLIAEAWGRRNYLGAFRNLLGQATGEATETQAWLDHARAARYLDEGTYQQMDSEWEGIGGMLQRMIQGADHFAPKG